MDRKRLHALLAVTTALTACLTAMAMGAGDGDEPKRAVNAPPRLDRHGDPLPSRAVSRLGTERLLHHDCVVAAAFSPDGRRFASAAVDRTVNVWQWPDGRALHSFPFLIKAGGDLPSLVFAPDGRYLAAVAEGNMAAWDLKTGRTVLSATALPGVAFAPDGSRVAWRESLYRVRVHDLTSAKELAPYRRQHRVLAVAFATDGNLLVAERRPGAIAVRDAASDMDLHVIPAHGDRAVWTQFSPRGDRLALQTSKTGIRLIDVRDGKERGRLAAPAAECVPIALSADGRSLAWREKKDAPLRISGLEQGRQVCTIDSYAGTGAQQSAAFSPDGKWIALGGTNHPHAASFWDARTGQHADLLPGHAAPLYAVRFAPDGKEIATCTAMRGDPIVRLWDPESGRLLRSFSAHRYGVHDVAYTPDGSRLITCGLWGDEDVCIWDARTLTKERKLKAHRYGAGYVAVSADGKRFASVGVGTSPDDVKIWDLQTGTQMYAHATLGQTTQAVAFVSARSLLVCNWRGLRRWDIGAPAKFGEWSLGTGDGLCMDSSADGRLLAVGQRRMPAPVRLIETLSGKEVGQAGGDERCSAVALAPDGRTLAIGTTEGEIRLLDWPGGQRLVSWPAYPSAVTRLTFSPDGRRLASSGGGIASATALVWNVADATSRPLKETEPDAAELAEWCNALVGTDAAAAHRAAHRLRSAPRRAVAALEPVIDRHGKSAAPAIREWIADLDSDVFDVRDQAHDALLRAGKAAVGQMVKALGNNPSVEQRVRLKHILDAVGKQPVSAEQLSASRIVMVLEWIASPEARVVLQQLAKGDPDASLTEQAQAALARLAMRKTPS